MDRTDTLVVTAVTGVALGGLVVGRFLVEPAMYAVPPWVLALAVAQGVVLWWRRTRPVAVLLATTGAVVALGLLGHPIVGAALGPMAAVHAVGAHATSRRDWALVPPAAVALAAVGAGIGVSTGREPDPLSLTATTMLLYGALFLIGLLGRTRREAAAQRTRAAVAEERGRIARELHDVVAHHVGVMTLHAGAGRRLVEADPEAARAAFGQIEASGRAALEAMPALVGSLRDGAGPLPGPVVAPTGPQPVLADLAELVQTVVAAGARATLTVEGDPRPLPPAVELSGYRIVQEALTNAVRHAGPARIRVAVRYAADAVHLRVEDDGRGASTGRPGRSESGGFGLLGMHERVQSVGGTCVIGPRPGGGFEVQATLPLRPAAVR